MVGASVLSSVVLTVGTGSSSSGCPAWSEDVLLTTFQGFVTDARV